MICWFHPFGSPRQKLTGQNKEWGSTSTKIHKAEREQSPPSTQRKKRKRSNYFHSIKIFLAKAFIYWIKLIKKNSNFFKEYRTYNGSNITHLDLHIL